MRKKTILTFVVVISAMFLFVGCSSKSSGSANSLKVTEDNRTYLEEYDKALQEFISDSTAILKVFNDSIDGLYTEQLSESQFATKMTASIEESNALLGKVEDLDIRPELFDSHQNLVLLMNRSHQLLLSAISMANDEERDIDKETLRSEYMDIKSQQATIANDWKVLREQLAAIEEVPE